MKKGLLRALSAVVAISMLFCMSMVAFAATPIVVETTYTTAEADTVRVVTSVVANPNEQVAFLVQKEDDIIWIDQQTADGSGNASSTFTDAAEGAKGATVKVGTTSLAASNFVEQSITLPNYTVTWKVTGGSGKSIVTAVANETDDIDTNAKSVNV